ncbi:methyltransferase [Saccharopolyspora phatthalungensis]|uniref:Methylase of polypeptide subunit release factors n=1 Tax=Saccharopolyspora phatthalungensis TaxID=664693 RepID=A0A840QD39_9PSEU|nr:class I SAM-dependent methyltransferase [Saccharopolyspora phatthalungensis]MBB5156548.1 methylase of polypeptide subunit release factors [Saccharopolyspora phatthalungensis]
MLWRADYSNARRLLSDLSKRLDRKPIRAVPDPAERFYRYRQTRKNRARVLGMLLVELNADLVVDLPRAPDVRAACREVYGAPGESCIVSLRELLGVLSAHQWRTLGVYVPALNARIHPHYGVFSPTRDEYVDLVASAEIAEVGTAFDIGTGTGVLAAVLARRGVGRVVATDVAPRAVACAQDNVRRLGFGDRVTVTQSDLFPPGRADLVVCNPPWLPATPNSALDAAVFDPEGRMLSGFIRGVADHLAVGGEAWLVLSNLAELLGLRTRGQLLDEFGAAGLAVLGRLDTRPRHPRAREARGPLGAARAAEQVSLWRLAPAGCDDRRDRTA